MNSRQRYSIVFAMLSLIVIMLGFQNCAPSGNLSANYGSFDDLVETPTVFASKTVNCMTPSTAFTASEIIYMCLQNAGAAPTYCHTVAGSTTCSYSVVTTNNEWSILSDGNWVRSFIPGLNGFGIGEFAAYVIHTDDVGSTGQAFFKVTN